MFQKNIEQLLNDLLSVKSVTKKKSKEIIDVARQYLESKRIASENFIFSDGQNDFHNLISYKDFGRENTITLLGHLDVIDADNTRQWRPYKKNGYLYARGSADDKGGSAAAILAFVDSLESNYNLQLILTTDEEIGGFHGAKKILESKESKPGDLTIAIEPFGDEIIHQHYGVLRFGVEFSNPTSHTKTRGENALKNYINFTKEAERLIQKYDTHQRAIFSPTYLGDSNEAVGDLEKLGQNPGYALAKYDLRTVPSTDIDKLYSELEELANTFDGVNKITKDVDGPSLNTDLNNEHVQNILKLGYKPKVETCSTDAKWVKGTAVVFGPKGYDIHGSEECVKLNSLGEFYKTLKTIFNS